MPEETTKKERVIRPALRVIEGPRIFGTVKAPKECEGIDAFEIAWPVPQTDEAAKERYDMTLADLVEAGVRLLSYRPAYTGITFEGDCDAYHQALQDLADGYKPGRTTQATGGVKAKAKKLDGLAALAEAKGMSLEDVEKLLAGM